MLPARINRREKRGEQAKRCPGHRAWVRTHACSACGSHQAIECAHVRTGTDGGMGTKPSDRWCISLCSECHRAQHTVGEAEFERRTGINMYDLAEEFARKSKFWPKLKDMA